MTLRSRLPTIARSLDEQVDPAIRRAAEAIAERAQSNVPVNTGRLKSSIHVEKQSEGSYAIVAGDRVAFYGHIVEHGSVNTPPHPFLIPAFEAVRDDIDNLIRAALRDL